MKRTFLTVTIFSIITFASCNSKQSGKQLADLKKDFPKAETLDYKIYLKKRMPIDFCPIFTKDMFLILDPFFGKTNYCYNSDTKKQISTLTLPGTMLENIEITKDSIVFYMPQRVVRTFSKNDFIQDIPVEERLYSELTIPDSIIVSQMTKLPDGSILATIRPPLLPAEKRKEYGINKKSVIRYNGRELKSYKTINYDSFHLTEAKPDEIESKELIQWAYAQGFVKAKDNNIAVFSVNDQFILYTLDLNTGKILNEKRYTDIARDGSSMSLTTTNDLHLKICQLETTDQYIFCLTDGYFSREDREKNLHQIALCVFDWELNPIKRYEFATKQPFQHYQLSKDCDAIYFMKYPDWYNCKVYKADINL